MTRRRSAAQRTFALSKEVGLRMTRLICMHSDWNILDCMIELNNWTIETLRTRTSTFGPLSLDFVLFVLRLCEPSSSPIGISFYLLIIFYMLSQYSLREVWLRMTRPIYAVHSGWNWQEHALRICCCCIGYCYIGCCWYIAALLQLLSFSIALLSEQLHCCIAEVALSEQSEQPHWLLPVHCCSCSVSSRTS